MGVHVFCNAIHGWRKQLLWQHMPIYSHLNVVAVQVPKIQPKHSENGTDVLICTANRVVRTT